MKTKKSVAAVGSVGRVVAARIERGEDVIQSVVELIQEKGFRSGTVNGIGSLMAAAVEWAKSTDLSLPKDDIGATCVMKGPVELASGWGLFGTDDEGSIVLHFHAIIMDKEGRIRAGNLRPGSAPVMATVDIVIQELIELDLNPCLDPPLNHKFFSPIEVPKRR